MNILEIDQYSTASGGFSSLKDILYNNEMLLNITKNIKSFKATNCTKLHPPRVLESKVEGWYVTAQENDTENYMKSVLMKTSPLVIIIDVYENFYHYNEGIYESTSGKVVGG
jgi:hypothetical protein